MWMNDWDKTGEGQMFYVDDGGRREGRFPRI